MKVILVGNLTIDENRSKNNFYQGPGGSVYFMAKMFENLGVETTIISAYGADFPKNYLPKTTFIPQEPISPNTLLFKNDYTSGKRIQTVKHYEDYQRFNFDNLQFDPSADGENKIENKNIVMIAPVINNINKSDLINIKKYLKPNFYCLLPQGLYRRIDKEGAIKRINWNPSKYVIRLFDFICFSEEDISNVDGEAAKWSRGGPMVIVTKAEKGVSLYQKGKRQDFPAFKMSNIKDPTGAGDIFAAAFVFNFLKSHKINAVVDFAQAAACLSLRFTSDKLQYGYLDIIKFIVEQKRVSNEVKI